MTGRHGGGGGGQMEETRGLKMGVISLVSLCPLCSNKTIFDVCFASKRIRRVCMQMKGKVTSSHVGNARLFRDK